MRNKFTYTFISAVLCFSLFVPCIAYGQKVRNDKASNAKAGAAKKVMFNPVKRNPFLSKEEVIKIEQMRKAELRRLAEEEAERKRKAEEERKRLLQQQILEEEMKRHPARAVMDKIHIDGILGSEAIVNGDVVGIGSKVLGAKVVAIKDDSVWFTYKGERFQRKLPLL